MSEDRHHRKPLLKSGGFGSFVCILGGEKEEQTVGFWVGAGAEGGKGDTEMGAGGRIEGGVEDMEGP